MIEADLFAAAWAEIESVLLPAYIQSNRDEPSPFYPPDGRGSHQTGGVKIPSPYLKLVYTSHARKTQVFRSVG
jgi:hypothetical protein